MRLSFFLSLSLFHWRWLFQIAESFKIQANDAFKDKHYQSAIDLYTKAIEAATGEDTVAVYYSNR